MNYDYCKDNFTDLDNLLHQAADNYNVKLNGSITNFVGCSVTEIRDVMYTTLRKIVPEYAVQPYLEKADLLMA